MMRGKRYTTAARAGHQSRVDTTRSQTRIVETVQGTPDVDDLLEQYNAAGGHGVRMSVQLSVVDGKTGALPYIGARLAAAMLEVLKAYWPAAYTKYLNADYFVRQSDVLKGQSGEAEANALSQSLGTVYLHVLGMWRGDRELTKAFMLDFFAAYIDQMAGRISASQATVTYEKSIASLRQSLAAVPSWRNEGNAVEWLPFAPPVPIPSAAQLDNPEMVRNWFETLRTKLWDASGTLGAIARQYPRLTEAVLRFGLAQIPGVGQVASAILPTGAVQGLLSPANPQAGGVGTASGTPGGSPLGSGGGVSVGGNNGVVLRLPGG